MAFLPVTKKEITERGWRQAEFLLVTGMPMRTIPLSVRGSSAEHWKDTATKWPSSLSFHGKDAEDFRRLGRPRLGCLINGGNVAATVNHFSAGKRRLYGDKYSPEVQPEKDRTGG